MSSTQQIRGRIKSVRNTRQITKAMQMVSASKLHRMQAAVQATQAYGHYARQILTYIRQQNEVNDSALYQERSVKNRLLIVMSSDRGLAGAYNGNVVKRCLAELKSDHEAGVNTHIIVFGRQGANFISRLKGLAIVGVYTNLPDQPQISDLSSAVNDAVNHFIHGEVDAVDLVYTKFQSLVAQTVQVQRLLPAGFTHEEPVDNITAAVFEPSAETVLESTTRRLLDAQVLQAALESHVSEQAMRMLAMKSASDNAADLLDAYTLELNNARQAAITQELAEISGGVEAMK